jgi:tetratricopeptide (TPR) repeat protein
LAYGQYLYQLAINRSFYGGALPQKETDLGIVYYNRALDLYKSVSNKSGQARARMGIGAGLLARGEAQDALDQYKEALRLSHEIGDLPSEEAAFRQMSAWYSVVKSYDLAILNGQRALGIARNIGDYGGECISLEGLALTMTYAGRFDLALEYINEAVEASLKSGDAFAQAAAYDNLGFWLYKGFNKHAEALTALERAYNLYSEVDSPLRDGTMQLINYIRTHASAEELNGKLLPRFPTLQ